MTDLRLTERLGPRLARADEWLVDRREPPLDERVPLDRIPWSSSVISQAAAMSKELEAFIDAGTRSIRTSEFAGYDQGEIGLWETYVMAWYGKAIPCTCARLPLIAEVLAAIPDLEVGGLTILGARSRIPRHQGPAKSLRFQVGLRVPDPPGSCGLVIGSDRFVWSDGAAVAFDDRTPHEAFNDSDEPRYVLFAQVPWPIGGMTGRLHRALHRMAGYGLRDLARKAAELDGAANGGR